MALSPRQSITRTFRTLRSVFFGQQGLAFLSAVMLGGYWFGGEWLLLFTGLAIPAGVAIVSIASDYSSSNGKDGLTGLPLRGTALHHLHTAMTDAPRYGHAAACFVLEIDDFADILTRFDRSTGEEIIARTAERLTAVLRDADVVARLEGPSFAVIPGSLRRADLETGIQMAARMQAAISEPLSINAMRIYVTASVGFSLPHLVKDDTATAVLDAAECALLEARSQGVGSIRAFAPTARPRRINSGALVDEIVEALDGGQIVPWFQPQVSTDTGDVTGFEALARWEHPKHGLIAPADFLPAVEAAGQMRRLSEVILYNALLAICAWDKSNLRVGSVSVNLSGDDLGDPKLTDRVRWELDRFDLSPERLSIEIQETVLASDGDDTIARNIAALSEMGVGVDLDDFGTGNTSIGAIRRFDIKRIMIDRSFVTRVDLDREQQDMVAAILSMADRLGVKTVAEGVETLGEHAMLAQLGCNGVQGYGIAPPMPLADIPAWIDRHRRKLDETPRLGRKKVG